MFKEQAVRFVLEEISPDESRKQACERLAPKLSMNSVTLSIQRSSPRRCFGAALERPGYSTAD